LTADGTGDEADRAGDVRQPTALDAAASVPVNVVMAVDDAWEPSAWRVAIIVSFLVWLAVLAGNIVLYAVRPAGHWPALENVGE
jgi:hypothetical protein